MIKLEANQAIPSGLALTGSTLRLTPAPHCLVHSRNVVTQGDPYLFVVDAMVGVRGDDPHALDLSPGNLRRRLDDLIRQLGDVAPVGR
jgi:hypothetical protein